MREPLEILYLSTAQKDLEEIFDYVTRDNPSAAGSLLEQFDRTILLLADNPELGVVPRDERLEKLGYRMPVIEDYLVFYVVKSGSVQIRRVIHGAREYRFLA